MCTWHRLNLIYSCCAQFKASLGRIVVSELFTKNPSYPIWERHGVSPFHILIIQHFSCTIKSEFLDPYSAALSMLHLLLRVGH